MSSVLYACVVVHTGNESSVISCYAVYNGRVNAEACVSHSLTVMKAWHMVQGFADAVGPL